LLGLLLYDDIRTVLMAIVYITSNNGKLSKKSETLEHYAHDGTVTIIFPFKTEQLVIIGDITITGAALRLLMKFRIETVFLNRNGIFNGKLEFQDNKNVLFRKKQFDMLSNDVFKLEFAKQVVIGKVGNQLTFVKRIGRKKVEGSEGSASNVLRVIQGIDDVQKKVNTATSLEQLRGYEGTCARYYFSIFKENISKDWAVFNGRSMNPPEDNVNAVLSFLYTLLYYRVDSTISSNGLDPYVGMFHAVNYGKHTLAFDLMEEFRVPLGDTICCALFNLGILEQEDFRTEIFSEKSDDYPIEQSDHEKEQGMASDKKGVLLARNGIRKVIEQFERKIETKIFYTPLMKQLSYKRIIVEQVRHYRRVLTGEESSYIPLSTK
jgi:CRISP-associated protein Cas1